MRTITIDILNEEAIKLLLNLESLKLIRLRTTAGPQGKIPSELGMLKGKMAKQPIAELDAQLKEMRQEWE